MTTTDLTPIRAYAGYMASIKFRLREIEKLSKNSGGIAGTVVQDSLALQLRFVIEAVYQSCIAAQFDHPEQTGKGAQREWNPKTIRGMFKGRPYFFPSAMTAGQDGYAAVAGEVLSESDAYSMYGYCGDLLHHKSLYKGSPFKTHYTEGFWDRYEAFTNKFIQLLGVHSNFVLQPDGSAVVFLCEMGWPDEKVAPRVIRAQSVGPLRFVPEVKDDAGEPAAE